MTVFDTWYWSILIRPRPFQTHRQHPKAKFSLSKEHSPYMFHQFSSDHPWEKPMLTHWAKSSAFLLEFLPVITLLFPAVVLAKSYTKLNQFPKLEHNDLWKCSWPKLSASSGWRGWLAVLAWYCQGINPLLCSALSNSCLALGASIHLPATDHSRFLPRVNMN